MSGMSDWRDPVEWLPPQPVPMLGADDIHLWRGHLPVGESAHNVVLSYLSDDERARAARYRVAHDRDLYIAARGTLRAILAQYLDDRPERLCFRYEPAGKPALVPRPRGASLEFNLSHSGELSVFAVAWSRRVGVDVEKLRSDIPVEDIAGQFFSRNELASLRSLGCDMKHEGFFRCWTRKEAYVKACGAGLQIPLRDFDVTLDPSVPARFTRGIGPSWQLLGFIAGRGYPAALVYDGEPANVRFLCADRMLPRTGAG